MKSFPTLPVVAVFFVVAVAFLSGLHQDTSEAGNLPSANQPVAAAGSGGETAAGDREGTDGSTASGGTSRGDANEAVPGGRVTGREADGDVVGDMKNDALGGQGGVVAGDAGGLGDADRSRSGSSARDTTAIDEAAALVAQATSAADVLEMLDLSVPGMRELAVARIGEIEEARREDALEKAARLGIPERIEGPGNKVSILHGFRGDEPIYRTTQNRNAAISSGATILNAAPYGLDGSGVKVGVWDAGSVRNTHRELGTGRVQNRNPSAQFDDHATHVAGTIGALGVTASAKGMAAGVAIDSYDWNSDYSEMTSAGAASAGDTSRIPISNHSYGYNAVTADMGRYEDECRTTDNIANSLPYYLIFWAAGNEQDYFTSKGGYQSITFNGLAKNILTVGAVNDAVTSGARDPSRGTMSYFSSWGPCDDGRIKPDVVANGVGVNSPISTGDSAYDSYNGTSMATPSAAGSAALLVELYAREFSGRRMRASMLKGLLIHTADDLGTAGPDYRNGWGLINVAEAGDVILAHKASLEAPKMIEGELVGSGDAETHSFQWDGVSPIRATLCWTEPAGAAQSAQDSRTPNLRHNLDLTIIAPDGSTVFMPYVMPYVGNWSDSAMSLAATTGKNNVDNVEQVHVPSPQQAGTYTVRVALDGSLTTPSQAYSLIVTGGASVETNPPPTVMLDSPVDGEVYLPGEVVVLTATASDKALGGGDGIVQSVEFFRGGTSLGIDTAAPYRVDWPASVSGAHGLTAVATDTEGATTTSPIVGIVVLEGDGAPAIASLSPGSGTGGDEVVIEGANFARVSSVTFGGVASEFTIESPTRLVATVPAAASSGLVVVTTPWGSAASSIEFTVVQSPVLISQVYGAGGLSGAVMANDYVELHNRSGNTVGLDGWSLQYASAAGVFWSVVELSGVVEAGGYCLVALAGGSSGEALPAADVSGSVNISSTQGKVALRNSTTRLGGSSPVGQEGVQDFVGYGGANAFEGTGAAPRLSRTEAIFRLEGGVVDTGDNRDDFESGVPNPRNSSFGSVSPPSVVSGETVEGVVGEVFSYSITATNAPTSYGASGLPPGLGVNTTTGVVSGIPEVEGTTDVGISASNSAGSGGGTLRIVIGSGGAGNGSVVLNEDFSSADSGNDTTTSGASSLWGGSEHIVSVSRVYKAGGVVKLGTSKAVGSLTTRALGLAGGPFTVSFKVKGWTSVEGDLLVSTSDGESRTVTYSETMGGSYESRVLSFSSGTAGTTVTISTSAKRAYLDDLVVTAEGGGPVISVEGSVGSVDAVYGSASTVPASFMVAGTGMGEGILVTAPAGFEVSQNADGLDGYAASQLVGGAGEIGSTPVHVRLAAGNPVDSYGGDVVLTSAGASEVRVAVEPSVVRPRIALVTADDRTKRFGEELTLGSSAFAVEGMVDGEVVGRVTLTANGGTSATDGVGEYVITPSNAAGGTFEASNYDIEYRGGTLTVVAPTFGEWAAGLGDAGAGGDPDGDGMVNLMEYFLGLNGGVEDGGDGVVFDAGDGYLALEYLRSRGLDGVEGVVEWNSDLRATGSWSTLGVVDTLVEPRGLRELRRAVVPVEDGDASKFLRLRVRLLEEP
jgi:hypothetical protein